ncbi:hypothetical protein EON79_08545 [bacterium]|nr:MAG: hypothetical protein EON79_08545 [bacterium]
MAERILCDKGIKVSVDGGGERTLLAIRDGSTLRFWTDTAALEEVLKGTAAQLSAHGGYCAIEVEGDRARLEFGLDGEGRKSCAFPARDLAEALAWVRSLPSPPKGEPDAVEE